MLHRSYENTNAPVKVNWFSDRIEIWSPGGPYGAVTKETFARPGYADYRNPHIAEAMKGLGLVQRFGVGIQTAICSIPDFLTGIPLVSDIGYRAETQSGAPLPNIENAKVAICCASSGKIAPFTAPVLEFATSMNSAAVKQYLLELQSDIVLQLEALDGASFIRDEWQRAEGGGGISRILEGGNVFERAGVLFSHVLGSKLPPSAAANRPDIAGRPWEAMGVSLVLHPRNPYVPTVHMNVRHFVARSSLDAGHDDFWFGGGMDLTPYYGFDEDCVHFHRANKEALDPFGADYYPHFKKWCDDYFYLKHRREPRGIGGVFFDDFHAPGFDQSFAMKRAVGDAFLRAYLPIVERRMGTPHGEREREWQLYRRGRYVEFNLVWDRGTHFGLQSGGRTESILASMPPLATWRYNWTPEPGTPEHALTEKFLIARDWV